MTGTLNRAVAVLNEEYAKAGEGEHFADQAAAKNVWEIERPVSTVNQRGLLNTTKFSSNAKRTFIERVMRSTCVHKE